MPDPFNYYVDYTGTGNSTGDYNITIGLGYSFYEISPEEEAERAELAEDKRKYPLFFIKEGIV